MLLLVVGVLLLLLKIDLAPGADDPFHLSRGRAERDGEKLVFVRRGRHARDRSHLRVRDFAFAERLADERQVLEGVGNTDLLARGAGVEPDAP